jgi:methylmalonyl-CoA mutase
VTEEFPAATAEQWRRLALTALRRSGDADESAVPADVDELLSFATYDGLRIAGLHGPDDPPAPPAGLPGRPPYVRGARAAGGAVAGWDVRQHHAWPDPNQARTAVLDDLENGATSIWLAVGGEALPVDALPDALNGVYLNLAGLVLDAGDAFPAAGRAWMDLLDARGVGTAAGGLGADPLGRRALTGDRDGLGGALREAVALAGRCVVEAPGVRAVTVDATVYHDAGGSDAEELGCAAAAGVAYLRVLTDAGLSVADALAQLEFRYAATADQFASIAKLRAARRIWARVAEMCAAPDQGGQRQHVVTSAAMMTARDPWANLLRATIASFAAGVGGADAVTVRPFDHRIGLPDALARRLARNTQLLLVEEAGVARVLDPAGGSWYVERYTDGLAQTAWAWFTDIEQAGGLAAALDSGLVADRLAATWQRRAANIAHRRDPITGVSEFPDLGEKPLDRQTAPVQAGGGLPRHHYAEAFERLRDRSDAHESRPTVFLATLGSPAGYGPRVTFASNLFAAGGIAVVAGPAEDFATSGSVVVCVCGPDAAYPNGVLPAVETLRAAGARRVWLAGKGDYPGLDGHVHAGCDAVATLTSTLDDLGVRR